RRGGSEEEFLICSIQGEDGREDNRAQRSCACCDRRSRGLVSRHSGFHRWTGRRPVGQAFAYDGRDRDLDPRFRVVADSATCPVSQVADRKRTQSSSPLHRRLFLHLWLAPFHMPHFVSGEFGPFAGQLFKGLNLVWIHGIDNPRDSGDYQQQLDGAQGWSKELEATPSSGLSGRSNPHLSSVDRWERTLVYCTLAAVSASRPAVSQNSKDLSIQSFCKSLFPRAID